MVLPEVIDALKIRLTTLPSDSIYDCINELSRLRNLCHRNYFAHSVGELTAGGVKALDRYHDQGLVAGVWYGDVARCGSPTRPHKACPQFVRQGETLRANEFEDAIFERSPAPDCPSSQTPRAGALLEDVDVVPLG